MQDDSPELPPEAIQATLARLQRSWAKAMAPHVNSLAGDSLNLSAGHADRLIVGTLNDLQHLGEIASYEYDSIVDPFTEVLHSHVKMYVPVFPEYIRINLRGPDA
jgi:hypothetical protein